MPNWSRIENATGLMNGADKRGLTGWPGYQTGFRSVPHVDIQMAVVGGHWPEAQVDDEPLIYGPILQRLVQASLVSNSRVDWQTVFFFVP